MSRKKKSRITAEHQWAQWELWCHTMMHGARNKQLLFALWDLTVTWLCRPSPQRPDGNWWEACVRRRKKNNDTFSLGCRSPQSSQACPPLKIDCERAINAGLCQEHPHVQPAGLMDWMLWISLLGYKKNESGGSSRVRMHNLVPNGWRAKLSTGEKLPVWRKRKEGKGCGDVAKDCWL